MKISKVLRKIAEEQKYELNTLSLIPSENLLSKRAAKAFLSRSYGRYILPIIYKNKEFMPGRELLEELVGITKKELCDIYNVKEAMIDSISGLNQMDLILSAMRKKFDKILILDRDSGGHSSTEGLAKNYSYQIKKLILDASTWDLDYNNINKIIEEWKNENVLIYLDHTVVLKPFNINKLFDRIPKTWYIYYDISHLQLFYFTGIYKIPKHKNIFFGGSTHKSFPGPQKAIILFNDEEVYKLIKEEKNVKISSVHTGGILALLITILEMKKYGMTYAKDVLTKTQIFAKQLQENLQVIGPAPKLTYTHQVCIEVLDEKYATKSLADIGIITVPMKVPLRNKFGLRLGIQELCRLGISENDTIILAEIIAKCINKGSSLKLKQQVLRLARKYRKVHYEI